MGILSELDSLLEKIPLWKRLKTVPDEVDRLKQQVAELEAYIKSSGGEKCPRCSQMSYSLDRTVDDPDFIGLEFRETITNAPAVGMKPLNSAEIAEMTKPKGG
ncbi:hypothetical protein [Klebsiella variicola]|uniref:hypothetical protein n=1 Tax=Klebsiella variicola TaxID=244366 RepID=UPI0038D1E6D7